MEKYKREKKKKKHVRKIFTEDEIKKFLESILTSDMYGIRNRCIFELMYASGMRKKEARSLMQKNIDFNAGLVRIEKGKGGKDRIVPLGSIAGDFIKLYLKGTRKKMLGKKESKYLFVTHNGKMMSESSLDVIFKDAFKASGIEKKGLTIHSIRHSFATHMLKSGADLRYIQDILGHKTIETTNIYLHTEKERIKKIFMMYHPRNNELYEEYEQKEVEINYIHGGYLKRGEGIKVQVLARKKEN